MLPAGQPVAVVAGTSAALTQLVTWKSQLLLAEPAWSAVTMMREPFCKVREPRGMTTVGKREWSGTESSRLESRRSSNSPTMALWAFCTWMRSIIGAPQYRTPAMPRMVMTRMSTDPTTGLTADPSWRALRQRRWVGGRRWPITAPSSPGQPKTFCSGVKRVDRPALGGGQEAAGPGPPAPPSEDAAGGRQ